MKENQVDSNHSEIENPQNGKTSVSEVSNIFQNKRIIFGIGLVLLSFLGIVIYDQGQKDGSIVINKQSSPTKEVVDPNGDITVHIEGAVENPGVYVVSANTRIYEVLIVAGNILPYANLSKLNLARVVKDGEKIAIPAIIVKDKRRAKVPIAKDAIIVNINAATPKELTSLPGIGIKYAKEIVSYRNKNGTFRSVEDLMKVKGIGPVKFQKVRPYVKLF